MPSFLRHLSLNWLGILPFMLFALLFLLLPTDRKSVV